MSDRCDSCGEAHDDLLTVQRIYLLFDDARALTGHRLADDIETWCPICRLTYPHELVAEG